MNTGIAACGALGGESDGIAPLSGAGWSLAGEWGRGESNAVTVAEWMMRESLERRMGWVKYPSVSQMARPSTQIVADIQAFSPVEGNWLALDGLIEELWRSGNAAQFIPELFDVLERFPDEDGAGVLWSILHGLESLPGYEPELVCSIQRRPSEVGIAMVAALLNDGTTHVAGASLAELLRLVSERTDVSDRLRKLAGKIATRHT